MVLKQELAQHVALLEAMIDKGVVIDAWSRIGLLSVDVLTVQTRVVVASLDTYLRYAEIIVRINALLFVLVLGILSANPLRIGRMFVIA